MSDETMTCSRLDALLSAYMEDDLDPGTHAELEAHAESCEGCGVIVSDLRAIRRQASLLPELVPSRDLWPGIAERIQAPVLALGAAAERGSVRTSRRWLAAAAAGLVVATAGITYQVTMRTMGTQPAGAARTVAVASPSGAAADSSPASAGRTQAAAPIADATSGRDEGPVASAGTGDGAGEPAVRNASATIGIQAYDREIGRLQMLARERKAQLDPATVVVIERNLRVIEAAIAQSREALAKDPASRFLNERLSTALDKKVELLRTVALLPSGT